MRPTPNQRIERHRSSHPTLGRSAAGENYGFFLIIRASGEIVRVIANDASELSDGWEHVSVSLDHRCPTWEEMAYVKDLFWLPTETVVQFHPPTAEYVNRHPFCLHLWRHPQTALRLPPKHLIG